MTDVITVISLARSHARRARFAALNGHVAHRFVEAVDGHALTDAQRADPAVFGPRLPYTPGAFGATLSHVRAWRQCVSDGAACTIAEDDVVFRHDFDARRREAIAPLHDAWDIVLWGWNLDFHLTLDFLPGITPASMRFDPGGVAGGSAAFQRGVGVPTLFRLRHAWGIPAYSITPKGAARLLGACLPLERFEMDVPLTGLRVPNVCIDTAMSRAYGDLDAHVCLPPLAFTENDHATSTIQVPSRRKGRLSRAWKHVRRTLNSTRP